MSPAKRNLKAPGKGGKAKASSLPPKGLSPESIAKQLADSDHDDAAIPDTDTMEHRKMDSEEVISATPLAW